MSLPKKENRTGGDHLAGCAATMLVAGFFCTGMGAGLVQFVGIGLIGVVLLPLGLVLLIAATGTVSLHAGTSVWTKIACALLFCAAAIGLVFISAWASSLAYEQAISLQRQREPPTVFNWTVLGVTSVLPALALLLGLRLLRFSWQLGLGWCIATLCVMPFVLLVFWSLLPTNPITA